jgi:glycosyltransferase involved in cell wall biosynthesis
MTPKICLLTESFYPKIGGGEAHARLLSATLVRRRVPVRRVGVPGSARWGKFLMVPAALLSLLYRRRDYDIIYACGLRTLGPVAVLVSWLTGCRCVVRAESCEELSGADTLPKFRRGMMRRTAAFLLAMRNALMQRADRFLSISSAIRREFLECGVPPERIVSIKNGIDTTRFSPVSPSERTALRRRLGLPDGLLCTYTGKLNRMKGLEMLLRAWRRLLARHPEFHLVLVGSGANQFLSCEDELRAFVREIGLERSVTFTGAVSNVHEYLLASDLFVFPSESEALPISLVEAMACGLPVVATRVGGIPDVVDDGVDGRLIEVGDEDGLVSAVEILSENPGTRAQFGRAARAKTVAAFGIDAVAEAHERLFRSLNEPPVTAPVVDY